MFNFLKKILTGSSDAEVKKLTQQAEQVIALQPKYEKMSDEELRGQTRLFRERYNNGESLDDMLVEAFAAVREGAFRAIGQRAFKVQLIGGIALHQGRIAEMLTGEGKTLTACFPAYLNAISGLGVHVVTVNDYLARFHSEWMGKVFRFMDMTVGLIVHDLEPADRQKAYAADVTYATNNELGFDYLRDNMATRKERLVQRPLNFAIVDEVDSILIDEARTPLIISGQGEKSTEMYNRADRFASRLHEGEDYEKDEKKKTIHLTEEGARKAEAFFGIENLTDIENATINHHVLAALRANAMMKRDVDYVVKDGQVVIVDEFTGRLMVGRRYSDGLHQAIEAKEHVKVERESKTLATITFQNYFRMYKKLSGMTGTAKTEEDEFRGIYQLDVVQIPTNRPMIRKDMNDAVFMSTKAKFEAVADEVKKRHETGQPVLVGTVSVEKSELVSRLLEMRGVPHTVLNAKFHDKEADIVAQAGKVGAVTIATNMAGRGTDILLGGNAEYLARRRLRLAGIADEVIEEAIGFNEHVSEEVLEARKMFREMLAKYKDEIDSEHKKVVQLGGLHIIGTERHESRRIDNQLRGRAGRQGDPGSSQFFISLQDDLMRLFGSDRISEMVGRLGIKENEMIEYGILSKQIENAQKKVEGRNYDIRKNVLQYDDVMNQQREVIYAQRRQVLMGEDMAQVISDMLEQLITDNVMRACADEKAPETWEVDSIAEHLELICLKKGTLRPLFDSIKDLTRENFIAEILKEARVFYAEREKMLGEVGIDMREFERIALLGAVDRHWMDHIDDMDQLRSGIGLRAYGHKDPVVEYKQEGYEMFEAMVEQIREDCLRRLYMSVLVRRPEPPKEEERKIVASHGEPEAKRPVRAGEKVGRNDPCPCGSGKKYKECCGKGK